MRPSGGPPREAGRRLAILIGIDQYEHGVPALRNASRDIEAVGALLQQEHHYVVRLIRDTEATLAGLRRLFAELVSDVTPEDRLLVYFAGHGVADEGMERGGRPEGYLLPQDAQRDRIDTYFPMDELQTQLLALRCRHMLLLLDCCFAGALRWSMPRSLMSVRGPLFRERFERYLREQAWQVITSAASDETASDWLARPSRRADQDGFEQSPFAAILCEGLRGAADLRINNQPGDGVITASELHLYLETEFAKLQLQLGRSLQRPLIWSLAGREKGQFIFYKPGSVPRLPSALAWRPENNPYRGSARYEESHRTLFFGRGNLLKQLLSAVEQEPLVVVLGASGAGKSSLIRAGLLPLLRERSSQWHILPIAEPGPSFLENLAAVLDETDAGKRNGFCASAVTWCKAHPEQSLLLFIDHLELLLYLPDSEVRRIMLELNQALTSCGGQLHLVLSLRADYRSPVLGEFIDQTDRAAHCWVVTPNREELREMIEGPAAEQALFLGPGLTEALLDGLADMPGCVALLSMTLHSLYEESVRSDRGDRTLLLSDLDKLQGSAGLTVLRAQRLFEGLESRSPRLGATARRLIGRMVLLDVGKVGRRRMPMSELDFHHDPQESERLQQVVDALIVNRLLVAGGRLPQESYVVRLSDLPPEPIDFSTPPFPEATDAWLAMRGPDAYLEPAHDSLILSFRPIWQMIQSEQESLLLHRRLASAVADWQELFRRDSLWSNDVRLPQALALLDETPERYNTLERSFLMESRRDHQARQRGQSRAILHAAIRLAMTSSTLDCWLQQKRSHVDGS